MRAVARWRRLIGAIGCLAAAAAIEAGDITVHVPADEPVIHKLVLYQCDATGAKLGLPSEPFSVEYIDSAGNSLAVLPVNGRPLIFANVLSASGARYAAQHYIWWEAAGRSITFSADTPAGHLQSNCQRLPAS